MAGLSLHWQAKSAPCLNTSLPGKHLGPQYRQLIVTRTTMHINTFNLVGCISGYGRQLTIGWSLTPHAYLVLAW